MGVDKALKLLVSFIIVLLIGLVVDAFIPSILQETNVAIQSSHNNLFQYSIVGLLVVIPIISISWLLYLKLKEI